MLKRESFECRKLDIHGGGYNIYIEMWNVKDCQSHAAQLPVLNGGTCSLTFHSTFTILIITKMVG